MKGSLSTPILKVDGLHKGFSGQQVLVDVSFELRRGDWLLLAGQNGAGKTVLAKCIAGLLCQDTGRVTVDGQDIAAGRRAAALKAGVDYIPQTRIAPKGLSVGEFLALRAQGRIAHRVQKRTWNCAVACARALRLSLEDLAPNRSLSDLDPYPLLMAYLLRGVLCASAVLIVDEPTAGIPREHAAGVFRTLDSIRKGTAEALPPAVLIISHPEQIPPDVDTACCTVNVVPRRGKLLFGQSLAAPNYQFRPGQSVKPRLSRWVASLKAGNRELGQLSPGDVVAVVGDQSKNFTEYCLSFSDARKTGVIEVTKQTAGKIPDFRYSYLPVDAKATRVLPTQRGHENSLVFHWNSPSVRVGPFVARNRVRDLLLTRALSLGQVSDLDETKVLSTLSGGNQQRFVVGRALAGQPDLLVCVDVFSGLDEEGVRCIGAALRRYVSSGHAVLLLTTNHSGAETALSDRTIMFSPRQESSDVG